MGSKKLKRVTYIFVIKSFQIDAEKGTIAIDCSLGGKNAISENRKSFI